MNTDPAIPSTVCPPAQRRRRFALLGVLSSALLGGVLGLMGCGDARPPLRTVPQVDLDRYLGTWYVIANIPYWLEEGKVATADVYTRNDDGTLGNTYVFRREHFDAPEESWNGTATVVEGSGNARWSVRFLWPFSADYLVIGLDPAYRWALIGHPSRDLLWVLARDRQMDPVEYRQVLALAAEQGYDITQVALVPQPSPPTTVTPDR